jgi:hypothetical protein
MADLIVHQLGTLNAIGNGVPIAAKSGGSHSVTATVQGSGSVSFTGKVMGTNDLNGTWTAVSNLSASGSATASASGTFSDDYRFWRFGRLSLPPWRLIRVVVLVRLALHRAQCLCL